MTDFYGNIDNYLPSVPTDTNLNFYGRVDNYLNQDASYYGNINNFLYWDKQFPIPVTYSYAGEQKILDQNLPARSLSWDGTNFTMVVPTSRDIYQANDTFFNSLSYANGETDAQSNFISSNLADDFLLGKSTLTVVRYDTRTATDTATYNIAPITTNPTSLSSSDTRRYISSDVDNKVYETTLTFTSITREWDVGVTDCCGVIFLDRGGPDFDEIWVAGLDGSSENVLVGYSYSTKEEIGGFTVRFPTFKVSDITLIGDVIWIVYAADGFIENYSRD